MAKLYRSAERQKLANMLEGGRQKAAQDLGISLRTLDRLVRQHGLGRPNYGPKGLTVTDADRVRELYAGGMVQKDLAELFGVSQPAVCKIVNNEIHRRGDIRLRGRALVRMGVCYGNS